MLRIWAFPSVGLSVPIFCFLKKKTKGFPLQSLTQHKINMKIIDKINKNKKLITSELFQWAETFNPENIIYNVNRIDEKNEDEMFQSYFFVKNLAEKLDQNKCNDKDYEDIIFHIHQINYNKLKIKL